MSEAKRIAGLFEKLYDGDPWIDVNLVATLKDISASQAAQKIFPDRNCIWEITNHLIQWRINVLKRVKGKAIQTPENNYIEPIKDDSEPAWAATLKQLENSQTQWLEFLNPLNNDDLEKVYPGNNMSCYELIQGIIQHDAYHLGQIVLLSKLVQKKQ